MSKRLKALKDIKAFKDNDVMFPEDLPAYSNRLLKHEAVKHIRYLQKHPMRIPNDQGWVQSPQINEGVMNWIKQFFGITPEDLE
jgi:hypothetical protein